MSTNVVVNTYAHSVVFVTDNLLKSFLKLIGWLGLDKSDFVDDWSTKERGVRTWIESRHLEKLILEIWDPKTDTLVGRWEAELTYSSSDDGNGDMWIDPDAIKHAIEKAGLVPKQCAYRLVAINKDGRPDVAGWTPTSLRSTDGLRRYGVGTTIGTQHVEAAMSYWRK